MVLRPAVDASASGTVSLLVPVQRRHELPCALEAQDRDQSPMPSRSFADFLAPLAFVLALLLLALGYGFVAARNELFPYAVLSQAEEAAHAFWKVYLAPEERSAESYMLPATGETGVVTADPARMAPGVTFMTLYTAEGFEGRLVDEGGKVLQVWRAKPSEVFPGLPHLSWHVGDAVTAWHGAMLLPDGDIVFNFQEKSFPYGGGLVRLSKDSKVVWAVPRNTHHDVHLAEDGTFWVPSMHYRPNGLPGIPQLKPWYYEDTVLHVGSDGTVLGEISVLEALKSYPGLLSLNYAEALEVKSNDPLHLNAAETLPAAWASAFPLFAPGDLLVSLRNINTIVVIDPGTGRAKWALSGPFAKQHDPDFLPNGHIMLFDNRGGDPACGGTRILELDPVSQKIVWSYDGCGGPPFDSGIRGVQQALPNGNVLVTETMRGRVFEVTRDSPARIVWDYRNALGEVEGRARLGVVTHAERIPREALTFLPLPSS
jgi:hypothetical protein